jgi:hypothetical protein
MTEPRRVGDPLTNTERDDIVDRIDAKRREAEERYFAENGDAHAEWRARKRAESPEWARFFEWCDSQRRSG